MLPRRCEICLLAASMLVFPSPGLAFDYEDLVELVKTRQITTIEQLLPALPAEFLGNYTLVHHSRSLHGASPDFPRVILFGRNAKLILTFNGSPHQSRFTDLEVMHFREAAQAFELRSISFDGDVRFSEANPAVCLGCHGVSPRPIWSSYEYSEEDEGVVHWPGLYGSTHDAPTLSADKGAAFSQFRERAATHQRYRHLVLRHPGSQWYPYGTGPHQHQFRPNNRLGNLLARLNAKRIAHHLQLNAFYNTYPSLALLWVLQCTEATGEKFVHFIEDHFRVKYPILAETAEGVSSVPGRLAFMFEKLLSGPDVFTWNMSLDPVPGDARFFTGIVQIDELVAAELLAGLSGEHWLKEYYLPWNQQMLYDTFRQGYYDLNVAPGGVGAEYDAAGLFYDRDLARQACPELARHAAAELKAPDSSLVSGLNFSAPHH